jgi:hypothetical protein
VDVSIDQVAEGEPGSVGGHDQLRLVYDRSEIDPKTHHVKLKNLQHLALGKYQPEHPDALFMPMDDAWLDLSAKPFALHYHASVTHGKPIIVDFDEHTRRLSIRSQADPSRILLGGAYRIDPKTTTGSEAIAAATGVGR